MRAFSFEGGAGHENDVAAGELPVDILERIMDMVRVREDDVLSVPVDEIGRGEQREDVANGGRVSGGEWVVGRRGVGEGPVEFGLRVETDGELLGATRKIGQAFEMEAFIIQDAQSGCFFEVVNAQDIEHEAIGRQDGVAFEPSLAFGQFGRIG